MDNLDQRKREIGTLVGFYEQVTRADLLCIDVVNGTILFGEANLRDALTALIAHIAKQEETIKSLREDITTLRDEFDGVQRRARRLREEM